MMNKINNGMLEKANGGYIFCTWYPNCGIEKPMEVIDDKTGSVIARFVKLKEAEDYAKSHGISTHEIGNN